MIHAAQNTVGAVQIQCCVKRSCLRGAKPIVRTDGLLRRPGRKRIRSEPSALNQLNNEHDDGNHEQKMDQTAANVTDKAQKPEHHEYYNYSPEHIDRCFFGLVKLSSAHLSNVLFICQGFSDIQP